MASACVFEGWSTSQHVLEWSSCILQTPILLTPSPLLSSIHFWSTLSPFAPLSPARLQGANTLFQVNYTMCLLLHAEMGRGSVPLPSVIVTHLPFDKYFTVRCRLVAAFPFDGVGDWGLWLSVTAQHSKKLLYCILLAQENTDV